MGTGGMLLTTRLEAEAAAEEEKEVVGEEEKEEADGSRCGAVELVTGSATSGCTCGS